MPAPSSSRRDAGIAVALAATGIALALFANSFATFPGDRATLEAVQRVLGDWFEPAADLFNGFLHDYGIRILWVASILGLGYAGRRVDAAMFIVIAPVGLITYIAKVSVGRPRPDGGYGSPEYTEALSFPSGHTSQAVAFFGLWLLIAGRVFPPRVALGVRTVSVAAIFLTGLSRVWVGAHWPSDVAGGLVLGAALIFGVVALRPLLERRI